MVGIFTGLGAGFERGSGASLGGVGLLGGAGLGRNNEGVFVNAATGNLLVTQRDEFLVGRGPDAEIARTYNSFGALDENGDHWRQSTDRRVFALTGTVNTAGSTVKRVSADGSEITYSWTGSYYQTTDGGGSHDRLTYSANVWTWRDGDSQWTETYSAYGTNTWRITGQSDISGNTLAFTYTGDQLTRVTTADGGYIQYSWSGSNITMMVTGYTNLATSTSQTLTRTRYGYDGQGRLNTVTVDLTPENNSVSDGQAYTTTYTYHGTSNRIATISQTDGSSLAIAYDGSGRVTSLTQTVASGDTRVTGFTYLAGETRVTDPRGQVTRLFYDSQNQLVGVEAPVPQTGGTASTVAFSYDAAGNLASMTDAAGNVTQYRYDAQGNVTYVRHPNGSTTLRVYDLANKLIQEIQTGAAITLPAGVGNQAPQAATNAITVTQQQGGSISLDVAALFSDPGDTLTYTVSGLPAGVSFNGQMITGTPSATGTYTITATASDGSLSASKTFTLSVVAVTNEAPIAVNDVVTVPSGTASSINVLFNDHDAENDALTIQIQGQPAHGAVSVSGGQVIYTPAAGYLGADSFTYRVQDANGGYSSVATVSLTVAAGGTPVVTAPTFVAASSATDSGTIPVPAGTQNGDLMVAVFAGYGSSTGTVSLPPGWTAIGPVGRNSGPDTTFTQTAYRIASSEPSSYSFSLSAGGYPVASIVTYRGASGLGPAVSIGSGNDETRTNSGLTTTQDNSRIALFSIGYDAPLNTPPSGMTQRIVWDANCYVWDEVIATAGATGVRSSGHTSQGGSADKLFVTHMVEILGTSSGGGAPLNHALVGAQSVAAISQAAGSSISLDLSDLFRDADNDALTFSATGLPPGMSLSGSALSGVPTTEGIYSLTVTASDGEYSAQVTFTIEVTAPLSGGVIAPVSWNLGSFFDNPAGTITYGASGYPSGLGVSGGVLSGTPATTGTWPVSVTAGRSVTMTVSAVPVGPPAPPAVPSGLPVTNGTSGDDWMYAGTGNGYYNGGAGWNTLEVSGSLSDYYFYAHSATEGLIVHKTTGQILVGTNFGAVYFDGSDEWMPVNYLFGVREGTSGAERIVGTDANELIEGGGGNDEIYSGAGNDHIDGGAGWDRINLYGEKADYTFLRHPDGKLSVIHNPTGKHDVVWNVEQFAFLSGPWSDQISDLTITDVTYAAPALVTNGGTINPVSWDIAGFFGNPSDPSIVYTVTGLPSGLSVSGGVISGTPAAAGNYTFSVTATRVVNLVAGYVPATPPLPTIPSGTPVVNGTSGFDYFVDTPGNQIYDGLGDWNMIEMGGVAADYDFFLDPVSYDAMMVHKTTGELTVLRNINGVSFSGNWQFFDNYYLFGVPDGTPGDDTIVGSALNDYIEGGAGTDYIYAGGGNNYIDGGAGDWDRVNFIGEKDDYTFLRHPDGKISAIHGPSGQHDVIWNVEYFAFNGGPWGDTVADLGVTDVAYAAPAFVPSSAPASPVTGFSNVVFASGGGGAPGTVSFNTGSFTFPAPVAGGVTVSAAHITAGLGDSTAVHMRHVYDAAGRLRYSVSGAGNVTEFRYNAAGQLVREVRYPAQAYSASAVATLAQMDAWRDGLADRSGVQIVEYEYDARGGLVQTVSWGAANTNGTASAANGYARTYYAYDQAGNLVSRRTEPDGYGETFVYDGLGRMTGSTDLNGGTTSIVFNDAATTTVITTGTGHVVTSVYNKAGDLISQTDSGSDSSSLAQVSYLYDRNGQVRRTAVRTGRTGDERTDYTYHLYDKSGRKVADIGHGGEVTEYRYDSAGRVVATVRYLNVLTSAQITSLSDPAIELELAAIRPTAHSFDLWQWTTYHASGEVATTVLGDGSVTRYAYDQAGRLIATYGYRNKIAVSGYMNGTSLGPAAATLPTAHAGDTVTRTFYDVDGRVRGVLNAQGHLSRILYDSAGQKVEETVYAGATTAGLRASGTYQQLWDSVSKDAAKDITSRYVYDGQGLLRFAIDALGRVTETIYTVSNPWDANGAVRAVVQFAGTLGALGSYDFAAVNTAVNALRADTNNRGVFNVYNDRGQVAYTIDSAGTVTGFTYDAGGRVTKTVQYAELRSTPSVPTRATMDTWAAANAANARTTRTYYSARGEVVATVDAEGYVTRNWYDAQGRLWDSRRYATAVTPTDAWTLSHIDGASLGTNTLTQYRYDARGRLSDIHAPDGTRSTIIYYENGQEGWSIEAHTQGRDEARTLLIYDQAGRVTEKRRYTADTFTGWDAAHVRELYTYDGLGNLASVTDANNTVTAYTYDRLGRVLTETRASGTAEAVTTAYEYDAFGQVVRVTDARGHSSYSYYDQAGRTVRTVDAENYLTVTQYTVFGEVHSVTRHYTRISGTPAVGTLPAQPAAHDLDATTSFTYDRLGRVLQATDATQTNYEAYTYNAFGNVLTHRNKLGGVTSYEYDALGRRTQETLPGLAYDNAGEQVAIINRFEYDSRGNLTKKIEAFGISGQTRTTTYQYDAASRLRLVIGDGVRTMESPEDSLSDLYTVIPGEQIFYDRRGNVIERIDANGSRTQTWYDKLSRVTHQLVQQTGTHGTLTRNTYDASGNVTETRVFETLVTMQANATGTPPAGSGNARAVTFEYDRLNRMIWSRTQAVWTAEFSGTAAILYGVLSTHYLYDAMGNVIRVTDPNGGQVHSYYDKIGRKTHEVDQERYRTNWEYDAGGNVLLERRFAAQVATPTSDPSLNTSDRQTTFTYDRLGRKLSETRANVEVYYEGGGYAIQDSTVSFTYNGLGQILTKTEAVDAGGSATNTYNYDSMGRLTSESRKAFTSYTNQTVTPTTSYRYDGLGNLVRLTEEGASGVTPARVTNYVYGAGGRLESVWDPEGNIRTYRYDRGGRIIREEYTRQLSTGGTASEAIIYYYDAQGRIAEQAIVSGSANGYFTTDQRNQTIYNAFGEVSARGVNGIFAEQFRYDNAGRLTATSAGDGIWKYFLYDRNGNQTLAITSTGMNIQNQSIEWALDRWGTNWGAVATTHVAGIVATLTRYDGRGLAVEVREPQRQRASGVFEDYSTLRQYNAFGEVISETNGRGHTVSYMYNAMGRLIRTESPEVNVTSEGGVTSAHRPVEYYYHDRSGRLVASRDANGWLTRQTLLAGSGFGGTEALITQTILADGAVINTAYDVHGNARIITQLVSAYQNGSSQTVERHRTTYQNFDQLGRLTYVRTDGREYNTATGTWSTSNTANPYHQTGTAQTFEYDSLGQQIRNWVNSLAESTLYDRQGRIQQHIARGGDATSYAYAWDGTVSISGFTSTPFGGWQKTVTYANTKTSVEREDVFGRMVSKTDMGGNVSAYNYNAAGQLTSRSGGLTINYTYYNTGKLAQISTNTDYIFAVSNRTTSYTYDRAGNLLTEYLSESGTNTDWWTGTTTSYANVLTNSSATYDALGRMLTWTEAGNALTPAASSAWTYDANGNIRSSTNTFHRLNAQGQVAGSATTETYWYRFDAMNRVTTDKGALEGGQIVRGGTGMDIVYDAAGQRAYALRNVRDYVPDTTGWGISYYQHYISREDYIYNSAGHMTEVWVGKGTVLTTFNGVEPVPGPAAPSGPGIRRAAFTYDALGRQTKHIDYLENGNVAFEQNTTYNNKSQVTEQDTYTRQSNNDWVRSYSRYFYGRTDFYGADTTANYTLGATTLIWTDNFKNNVLQGTSSTVNSYHWFDGASLNQTTYKPDIGQSTTHTSTHAYSLIGGHAQLTYVNIADGRSRTVSFNNDMNGQTIRRDERDNNSSTGDPHEVWYRFGGKEMGYSGNNGTLETDYQASIGSRRAVSSGTGAFRNGAATGAAHTDFDRSLDKVNSYNQGASASGYTVRAGDTLSSIASNLWGDANLWYTLAQANGLSGEAALIEGLSLRIPAGVIKNTHNASTYKPYDPAETIGDTAPTTPKPPKKNKCGTFGQVLLLVIAVVVSRVLDAYLPGSGTLLGKMFIGAVSSATSQAVGVATGIQEKFSWNQVALSAISAGVTKQLGNFGGGGFLGSVINGASQNAITQGIGLATGLQKKFSWAGVAAAGLGNAAFAKSFGSAQSAFSGLGRTAGDIASHVAAGTASAVADAAARTAMGDGQFGDNFRAAIPNVIGQALGSAIGGGLSSFKKSSTSSLPPEFQSLLKNAEFGGDGQSGLIIESSVSDIDLSAEDLIGIFSSDDASAVLDAAFIDIAAGLAKQGISEGAAQDVLARSLRDAQDLAKVYGNDELASVFGHAAATREGFLAGLGNSALDMALGYLDMGRTLYGGGPNLSNPELGTTWTLDRGLAEAQSFRDSMPHVSGVIEAIANYIPSRIDSYAKLGGVRSEAATRYAVEETTIAMGAVASLLVPGPKGRTPAIAVGKVSRVGPIAPKGSALRAEVDAMLSHGRKLSGIARANKVKEVRAFLYTAKQARNLGYEYVATLSYSGNKGIDAVFFNAEKGAFAAWESKSSLRIRVDPRTGEPKIDLKKDSLGLRQGTRDWVSSRLQRYLDYGDGQYNRLVTRLQTELADGNLRSFVSSRAQQKTFEIRMVAGSRVQATEL